MFAYFCRVLKHLKNHENGKDECQQMVEIQTGKKYLGIIKSINTKVMERLGSGLSNDKTKILLDQN